MVVLGGFELFAYIESRSQPTAKEGVMMNRLKEIIP
jgi:hypothetical protein